MLIKDVMTDCPHTVGAGQTIAVAKKLMSEHSIRHLPVQQSGKLIGILSERDVYFADRLQPEDPDSLKVSDVCTLDPEVFEPSMDLKQVSEQMANSGQGCALVAEGDSLCGIFTTTDACRVLSSVL